MAAPHDLVARAAPRAAERPSTPGDVERDLALRVNCDHAERCGGCPLLGLTYGEQLVHKRARVATAFARYPWLDLAAPAALRERIRAAKATGGALAPFEPDGGGSLRAVDLREVREGPDASGARVLVTFVVERARAGDLTALGGAARELMRALPQVAGVAANFHTSVDGRDGPQILGSETRALAGVARAPDRVGASVHFATFGSFVQAHRGQTERVHALLAEAVGVSRTRPPRVLDLYGGSGSIALALAAAGARVVLVESFAPAAQ